MRQNHKEYFGKPNEKSLWEGVGNWLQEFDDKMWQLVDENGGFDFREEKDDPWRPGYEPDPIFDTDGGNDKPNGDSTKKPADPVDTIVKVAGEGKNKYHWIKVRPDGSSDTIDGSFNVHGKDKFLESNPNTYDKTGD